MKKTIALVLALLLAIGLFAGCGAPQNTETSASAEGGASGETKSSRSALRRRPMRKFWRLPRKFSQKRDMTCRFRNSRIM